MSIKSNVKHLYKLENLSDVRKVRGTFRVLGSIYHVLENEDKEVFMEMILKKIFIKQEIINLLDLPLEEL